MTQKTDTQAANGRRLKIFICSPFGGKDKNVKIAEEIFASVIEAGGAPFAPHLIYPPYLDENNPAERAAGIEMGLLYMEGCDQVWSFIGINGKTEGMLQEELHARKLEIPVVFVTDFRVIPTLRAR